MMKFGITVAEFREHGFPITEAAAAAVENLTLVPLEDGGIQIELHSGGVDLEVLINADGRVEDLYIHRVENIEMADSNDPPETTRFDSDTIARPE